MCIFDFYNCECGRFENTQIKFQSCDYFEARKLNLLQQLEMRECFVLEFVYLLDFRLVCSQLKCPLK